MIVGGIPMMFGGAAAGDPNFASRALGLHFEGADNSTTFTDSSPTPKTLTAYGNARIRTDVAQFGNSSGYFDGTGDYLTAPNNSAFLFGAGDFTIRFGLRLTAAEIVSTAYMAVAGVWGYDLSTYRCWQIYLVEGKLQFSISLNGATQINAVAAVSLGLTADTFKDIEISRVGSSIRAFAGGSQVGPTYNIGTNALFNATTSLAIGMIPTAGDYGPLSGRIDEIEIYKGVGLHSANFTPPTAAFSDF